MMIEAGTSFSRASLCQAIHERFGPGARFFTCSAEGLIAEELIDFLAERGKFVAQEDGFTFDRGKTCRHD